ADDGALSWSPDFRPVGLIEGLSLLPLGGLLLAIETAWSPPDHARWRGPILFDAALRDAFRGRSRGLQIAASTISDRLFIGGVIVPVVVDVGVVALGLHRAPGVALQLLLIDLESLAAAGLISLTAEHAVGRARPYVQDCGADGLVRDESGRPLRNHCGSVSDFKSFFSGHAAATGAIAGLTCLHHQHLALYGGGAADLAPCLFMIALSMTTGVGRIVADRHWASDVLTGWGIGALSGYLLPALLHYGFGPSGLQPISQVDAHTVLFGIASTL
ncbi:MAG TPA: phosphatase PAP2 family protein, partial [Polyangiales bacterium]|nr:phosphatase PAP2 family protein [Polyangiales bacterium]